jgi:peptidyl-prolyl cis-trans isomerase-like protein 2
VSSGGKAAFKRLPFNFCAVSLQPFEHPVCTAEGVIFDLLHILPWIKKHGTNPVNGEKLESKDLIKLNFQKNEDGEYVDPVTFKVFTDNTHIVAIKTTGNVFAWDTIERLNIKAKNWHDLVSDREFTRKDLIVLQDPQNLSARSISDFKYLKDGVSTLTPEQEAERADPMSKINTQATGSAAKILAAKEALAKARARKAEEDTSKAVQKSNLAAGSLSSSNGKHKSSTPYNAAGHTTGQAAASFTSTGLTPYTTSERALLTEEEYMLKPKRVKNLGYARIQTNYGDLTIELHPEFAPKAVYNFVMLSKKGYYRDLVFHRNIKNFMVQGGDPTGTGRGGSSYWGKNFNDEFEGPLTHSQRGTVSMANKGKNTNSSQFFITYKPAKHLDRKHTIFGKVVGGLEVLDRMESAKVGQNDRPIEDIQMIDVAVFVDPFEEFQKERREREEEEKRLEQVKKAGGTEDDRTTWTGKRIRMDQMGQKVIASEGVGKYLKATPGDGNIDEGVVEEWDQGTVKEPARKKTKVGGFGNFDSW